MAEACAPARSQPSRLARHDSLRGQPASGAASLCRVLALGALLDDLGAEGGQVVGSAAGHEALGW